MQKYLHYVRLCLLHYLSCFQMKRHKLRSEMKEANNETKGQSYLHHVRATSAVLCVSLFGSWKLFDFSSGTSNFYAQREFLSWCSASWGYDLQVSQKIHEYLVDLVKKSQTKTRHTKKPKMSSSLRFEKTRMIIITRGYISWQRTQKLSLRQKNKFFSMTSNHSSNS